MESILSARRVIEGQPGAAILNPLSYTVGGRRRGAAALRAGNHRRGHRDQCRSEKAQDCA